MVWRLHGVTQNVYLYTNFRIWTGYLILYIGICILSWIIRAVCNGWKISSIHPFSCLSNSELRLGCNLSQPQWSPKTYSRLQSSINRTISVDTFPADSSFPLNCSAVWMNVNKSTTSSYKNARMEQFDVLNLYEKQVLNTADAHFKHG